MKLWVNGATASSGVASRWVVARLPSIPAIAPPWHWGTTTEVGPAGSTIVRPELPQPIGPLTSPARRIAPYASLVRRNWVTSLGRLELRPSGGLTIGPARLRTSRRLPVRNIDARSLRLNATLKCRCSPPRRGQVPQKMRPESHPTSVPDRRGSVTGPGGVQRALLLGSTSLPRRALVPGRARSSDGCR